LRKSSFFKLICLTISLALLLITPLNTSFSAKLQSTQKTSTAAETQRLDFKEDEQAVLSYKRVYDIPESLALEMLESHEEAFSVINLSNQTAKNEEKKGNPIDSVKSFLELYKEGINDLKVYLVDIGGGLQEFYADYYDNQGNKHTFVSGIYYDEAKGLIYGKDKNGVFALGFDFDVRQLTIYAAEDGWNREFGFCELYDYLSPLISYEYETVRVKFNYDKKDWMIQLWKGRYIVAMGAEVGVYYKPEDRFIEFYDSADDDHLLPISMRLSIGKWLLFERPMQPTWWQSGFRILTLIVKPCMLKLETTIVFPNADMQKAFLDSLEAVGGTKLSHTVEGNAVNIVW